jgi:heterodisulfide reductase subunit A
MSEKRIMVIGGGPAGLEASRGIVELGYELVLVEHLEELGGSPISADYAALTPDMEDTGVAMARMVDAVVGNENADIRLSSSIASVEGSAPNFRVTVESGGESEVVEVGSIIVATGFKHFDPGRETQRYGYYEFDDVITLLEAERMLKGGGFVRPSTGEPPKTVCFIQCVGSRDRQIGNQWCSKVCCGVATKEAIEIKHLLPECRVIVFYIDMRVYGFWEDQLYWKAQEEHHVNFIRGIISEVTKRGDTVVVKGEDTTMGRPMEVPMDFVILSVGMEPSDGTLAMAEMLGLPLECHGWIETIDGALNTVQTPVDGVFVAGAAAGPADLEDSISMGGAAALKACSFVRRTSLPTI